MFFNVSLIFVHVFLYRRRTHQGEMWWAPRTHRRPAARQEQSPTPKNGGSTAASESQLCRCGRPCGGVAMVMCVCSSWAGSTQLAKLTFKQFDAPFTITWFATTWNCLFFPLYYIGHLCKSPERQTPRQRFRWGKLSLQSAQENKQLLYIHIAASWS